MAMRNRRIKMTTTARRAVSRGESGLNGDDTEERRRGSATAWRSIA